jgi:hypothetical protein
VIHEEAIDRLISCESGGKIDAVNHADAKINGYSSRGILQFSPTTFLNKGKQFGFFPASFTLTDSSPLIWNPHLQKSIAKEMLKEKNGWRHWTNCILKKGIPALLTSL